MALQKTTISVNIAKSVNQKEDPKLLTPDKLAKLFNAVFTKIGRIAKRFGFSTYSTDIVTSETNPFSITTFSSKSGVFEYFNQLLLQNGGAFYSWFAKLSKWVFKSYYLPVEIDSEPLPLLSVAAYGDVAESQNIRVVSNGQYYSVVDTATGSYLIKDGIVSLTGTGFPIAFSNSIVILYKESTTLKTVSVNLVDGSLSASTTIVSDHVSSFGFQPDATRAFISVLGEVAAFAYYSSSPQIKCGFINTSGALVTSPGILSTTETASGNISIHADEQKSNAQIFLSWISSSGIKTRAWSFTASAYTPLFSTITIAGSNSSVRNIFAVFNPNDYTKLHIFYDSSFATTLIYNVKTYYAIVDVSAGSSTSQRTYAIGIKLASKAYKHIERGTMYFVGASLTPLQQTFYLFDIIRNKINPLSVPQGQYESFIIAKFAYGVARPLNTLPQLRANATNSSILLFTSGTQVRTSIFDSTQQGILYKLNIAPTYTASSKVMGNNLQVTGGFPWLYDGGQLVEQNFFQYPEVVNAWAGAQAVTVSIIQQGSASLNEITEFTFHSSAAINALKDFTAYFKFWTTVTDYQVYFSEGLPPGSGNPIPVVITPEMSTYEIASAVVTAINASGAAVFAERIDSKKVRITNTSNGSVTDGSVTGFLNNDDSLSAGSYSCAVTYRWEDNFGQYHVSSPSATQVVTATANAALWVDVVTPILFNKPWNSVYLELYRSAVNSTSLKLANAVALDFTKGQNNITGGQSDLAISTQRLIYTTGGVLENYQLGSFKYLANFKNCLMASGLTDDPFAVYISKPIVQNEPINFTEEVFFRIDADGQEITGIAQLDDKIMVFKNDFIYYVVGDPPDDTGSNGTLSKPIIVAGDTGCENHNSIIVYPDGLLFKSSKGIYKIDRSLSVQYIGNAVEDYNQYKVSSAVLLKDRNEIRFTFQDNEACLCFNYFYDYWSVLLNHQSDSATLYGGIYHRVKTNGKIQKEVSGSYVDVDGTTSKVQVTFELPWLKIKDNQDYQRVKKAMLLGEYATPHVLNVNAYYDYDLTSSDSYVWDTSQRLTGTARADSTYQALINLKQQKCQALKLKFVEDPVSGSGESATWNEVAFEVGLKTGLNKLKPNKGV